ncbi:hypothetical protein PFISCL1PPCAC_16229 [Pristionchus fissidentatus]|uniref:ADP ribosylation factor n=1 Tax=Pristionchus fissidentatus TaxID=1538716 RepID=A0AAV5W1V0_9BILA|nr:hypothetical protein PFISCL1PPCAC_16229 [Pristionchus fissidentatus]
MGDSLDVEYQTVRERLDVTMANLHNLYRMINGLDLSVPASIDMFSSALNEFAAEILAPCIEHFKHFCNHSCDRLWLRVRAAQIDRMRSQQPLPDEPIMALAEFYSRMMHSLAVLAARLQGFRYELTQNRKIFGSFDPVMPLSEMIFSALELLMADCVLSTEPSTNAILVTNNLFQMNCGALARGVVFKDFDVQVVSEEAAEHIQSELRSQRLLQQPSPLGPVPSAALLAMKPTSGTKRANAANNGMGPPSINLERMYVDTPNNTAHKKSDVNSKDSVTIYPVYNAKNRYWLATYPHLLCTTRQKGRTSVKNSFEDLSPAHLDKNSSSGKRPIFYFHIRATLFSPSGRFACAHTLSLPFTIATRRNQDCQVQRMMSSYTASIFWLYGCNVQDGLLLQWTDVGMRWDQFKHLYKQHFSVNAEVIRPLVDEDFDLLQYKLQCQDCQSGDTAARINGAQKIVTFKNVLCPHLRYECGSTNVRFSVWRGMLELLQIFHDKRNNVHKLWEKDFLHGFLEFDQVDAMLERHYSALIMRLSFVTGGTICFTVKSTAHCATAGVATRPMHLEPLDLKKLQAKCLKDYLRDIADAEKVKYLMKSNGELIRISDVLENMREGDLIPSVENERSISSNVTHSGDIDAMQHIRFTAMRIAVVTCKVKPPSADLMEIEGDNGLGGRLSALLSPSDDFMRELIQLCNFHGKSKLVSWHHHRNRSLDCVIMKPYRAVVLGAPACGKSALIRRFVENTYTADYEPTIEEKYTKKAIFAGIALTVEIIDTAGKELVSGQHETYFENADAFVVCYAVDDKRSYEHAVRIFSQIARYRGTHSIPRVLVGTKLDSPSREISLDSGNVLSAQLQCSFAETSAMHNINVTEVFEEVVSQIRYVEGMRKKMEKDQSPSLFCCLLG